MADAFKWGKDLELHLDNSTGTLVEISDYVNDQALQTAFDVFRTDGVGSSDPERQHGKADASVPLNGWINSTTEAIFGPLQVRLDYRIFNLRGGPVESRPQRFYAGLNIPF